LKVTFESGLILPVNVQYGKLTLPVLPIFCKEYKLLRLKNCALFYSTSPSVISLSVPCSRAYFLATAQFTLYSMISKHHEKDLNRKWHSITLIYAQLKQ